MWILAYLLFHYVFQPIRVLFPIFIVATILVYLLNPLVTRLERRGIRRGFGAAMIYLAFFLVVGIAVSFLAPIVVAQVKELAVSLPDLGQRSATWLHSLLDRMGLDVSFSDLLRQVQEGQSFAGGFLGRVTSLAGGVLEIGLIMVVGPILAFYLLVDFPKMKAGVKAAIPLRRQQEWQPVFDRITRAIGGFFRGQLLVAAFVGLASMFVLWLVGLPYWALVGIISGVFNIVPMIGPYIAAAVAIIIALSAAPSGSSMHLFGHRPAAVAAAATIGLLIVQQIDNHIISPNVVARTVKLHPVTVMLSLFTFGIFFGFWGLLLAVPTVATTKILVLHYWDTHATWPPEEPISVGVQYAPSVEDPPATPAPTRVLQQVRGTFRRKRRRS